MKLSATLVLFIFIWFVLCFVENFKMNENKANIYIRIFCVVFIWPNNSWFNLKCFIGKNLHTEREWNFFLLLFLWKKWPSKNIKMKLTEAAENVETYIQSYSIFLSIYLELTSYTWRNVQIVQWSFKICAGLHIKSLLFTYEKHSALNRLTKNAINYGDNIALLMPVSWLHVWNLFNE